MSKPIPDIIESWTNKISISENAYNLTIVDNTTTFDTCNTWWALECQKISINGVDYKVNSIVRDVSITVDGIVPVLAINTWSLHIPFFIHGTPTQANVERDLLLQKQQVTPMIYLFEPILERFNEEDSLVEREVDVRIALMHNYKNDQFTNDIYDYSIRAMRKLAERFIYTIKKQHKEVVEDDITYKFTSFAKYGNYITDKGSKANLFNENLSGIELNMTIPFKKNKICCTFT